MPDDPSPSKGAPFNFSPSARVVTTWQSIGGLLAVTVIIVGGLLSIKADLATATVTAKEARDEIKELRADVYRLRVQLGVFDTFTSHQPTATPRNPQP